MRIHILGISGTFMGGVALLAKEIGYEVSGSDMNVYPPVSTALKEHDIPVMEGYELSHIDANVDCVIVGNVIKRGNVALEFVLNQRIPYTSGPEWLAQHVLKNRTVLAIAGTHGKTTTTSLVSWILDQAGFFPGFLIGGIPENFGKSARLGQSPYFVIEADEYDTAFFDKRSKFIHYRPDTLIFNNLEYDHADIFPDMGAIQQQFHYLIRTLPSNGAIVLPAEDLTIREVLAKGCWTPLISFGTNGEWQAQLIKADGSQFTVLHKGEPIGDVNWHLVGQHNVKNALAAIATAVSLQINEEVAIKALTSFKNVKRRLEIKGKAKDITIYDDFAHHPTAIATTLAGLRAKIGKEARMIAVLEFGSYTMRSGVHKDRIEEALQDADIVICKNTEVDWGLNAILAKFQKPTAIYADVGAIIKNIVPMLRSGDHVVVMSNSGFGNIHKKLLDAIEG